MYCVGDRKCFESFLNVSRAQGTFVSLTTHRRGIGLTPLMFLASTQVKVDTGPEEWEWWYGRCPRKVLVYSGCGNEIPRSEGHEGTGSLTRSSNRL